MTPINLDSIIQNQKSTEINVEPTIISNETNIKHHDFEKEENQSRKNEKHRGRGGRGRGHDQQFQIPVNEIMIPTNITQQTKPQLNIIPLTSSNQMYNNHPNYSNYNQPSYSQFNNNQQNFNSQNINSSMRIQPNSFIYPPNPKQTTNSTFPVISPMSIVIKPQ